MSTSYFDHATTIFSIYCIYDTKHFLKISSKWRNAEFVLIWRFFSAPQKILKSSYFDQFFRPPHSDPFIEINCNMFRYPMAYWYGMVRYVKHFPTRWTPILLALHYYLFASTSPSRLRPLQARERIYPPEARFRSFHFSCREPLHPRRT